jgi:hypothetical protein
MNLPFDTTTDSRLPQNVKPMHYDLTIRTDLEESVYDGTVIVQCVTIFDANGMIYLMVAHLF